MCPATIADTVAHVISSRQPCGTHARVLCRAALHSHADRVVPAIEGRSEHEQVDDRYQRADPRTVHQAVRRTRGQLLEPRVSAGEYAWVVMVGAVPVWQEFDSSFPCSIHTLDNATYFIR